MLPAIQNLRSASLTYSPKSLTKRLAILSGAVLLAFSGVVHADAFSGSVSGKSDAAALKSLEEKLTAMAETIEELKKAPVRGNTDDSVRAQSATSLETKAKRVSEFDILTPDPYEVIGTVNGLHMVKAGDMRFLLNDADLAAYEKKALTKLIKERDTGVTPLEVGGATPSGVAGSPPLPPPPPAAIVAKPRSALKYAATPDPAASSSKPATPATNLLKK